MSHRRVGRKLGVVTKHRVSMFRNMVTDLLRHESLKTTDTRAKELRRLAEKMITLAKRGTLHSRRQAAAFIRDRAVLKKLFDEIAQKYKTRPGGYTRIIKYGFRKGDNAPLSIVELVEEEFKSKGKKKTKKPSLKETSAAAAASDIKSSKKEAAEELGLIEKEAEAEIEEPRADAQEPAGKPEGIGAGAKEAEVGEAEGAPEAKVEESAAEPEAKKAEAGESSPESTESPAEEVQAAPEAKAEGSELKDEGSSEDSDEVVSGEEKKDT